MEHVQLLKSHLTVIITITNMVITPPCTFLGKLRPRSKNKRCPKKIEKESPYNMKQSFRKPLSTRIKKT
jgi:hypothetical protein